MPAAAQNDWRHQVLRQALAYARIGWRLVPCEFASAPTTFSTGHGSARN
jgi:hypothetical protein